MTNFSEMNNIVRGLASDWEQFKIINNRRSQEIKNNGTADSLTEESINKLNKSLDEHTERLKRIETSNYRPQNEDNIEIKNAPNPRYKKAFCDYIKKGIETEILELEKKSSLSGEPDSGYSITNLMNYNIFKGLESYSPIRRISRVTEISTDALEILEDNTPNSAGWSSEINSVLNNNKITSVSRKVIVAHMIYAQPEAPQTMIDDPRIDIEEWLSQKLLESFSKKENEAFIKGDGIGKPFGILHYANNKNISSKLECVRAVDKQINYESILRLFFSLNDAYAHNAKFLVSRDAMQAIRMLTDSSTGRHIWQPSLALGMPDTLLGVEILQSTDMPSIYEDDAIPMAFGDFYKGYQIVDRGSIKTLRDPYTHKPFVKFYTTKRVGGDVVDFNAIKLLCME